MAVIKYPQVPLGTTDARKSHTRGPDSRSVYGLRAPVTATTPEAPLQGAGGPPRLPFRAPCARIGRMTRTSSLVATARVTYTQAHVPSNVSLTSARLACAYGRASP